ncbi:MAG TPA: hypothetical protein QGF58_30295 [Myxococcota bacterium]|nr:hypothetical protein [Myxococcota bacterium]
MLLLLVACTDYQLGTSMDGVEGWDDSWTDEPTDGAANIQVLPDPFDFGTVATLCGESSFPFFIRNVGNEPLLVEVVELSDATWEVTFDVPKLPDTLQAGEWVSGTATYVPEVHGGPSGVFSVLSDDPDAPVIDRPLGGDSCGDIDGDGLCDGSDPDRDGDGIDDADDPFPEHIVVDDVHVGFDGLAVGTRVLEQYADLGVHLLGGGAPGEGYDTNVVERGATCTTAVLSSSPNVLCTYVAEGFNHAGEPGFAGWLDERADAIIVRLYNAGLSYAATNGADRDQATLVTYDVDGTELGTHTALADTDSGEEYLDLVVMGEDALSFELFTGDFDAVDDLYVFRLDQPECN